MQWSAKVENGRVVALDYGGTAAREEMEGWLPLHDEQPEFDPDTHAAGLPTFEVQSDRVVAVYTVVPLPAPQPDPSDALTARIQSVHDDPQVSASVKKLAAALLGVGSDSAVAGRPTTR